MTACGGRDGSLTRYRALALPALAAVAALAACSRSPEEAVASRWGVLRYCTDCHNDAELAGQRSFEHARPADVAAKPEVWEKVVRKLRGHLMPPPGEPRPDAAERRRVRHVRSSAISTRPRHNEDPRPVARPCIG